MLMLLYVDDLVLLAPSRSDLTTALEELERITRKWGMVVNYPKIEAVVFGMPAATAAAATIQVGSNSVAVKPQFKYVGSIVQADALRSEWPFIIIIIILVLNSPLSYSLQPCSRESVSYTDAPTHNTP